jgi:hypothetical protein
MGGLGGKSDNNPVQEEIRRTAKIGKSSGAFQAERMT